MQPEKGRYFFTSESVTEGHPDKVADQISDAVLDACLAQDPMSRVAAETLCNTGLVVLAGEITTNATVDYIGLTRDVLKRIGYDNTEYGIDHKGCSVLVGYDKQSNDIAQGVDAKNADPLVCRFGMEQRGAQRPVCAALRRGEDDLKKLSRR